MFFVKEKPWKHIPRFNSASHYSFLFMGFFSPVIQLKYLELSCACCLPVALSSDAAMQSSHQCTPLQEELSLAGMQQFANDVLEIGSRSFEYIHAVNVIKLCTRQDVRYLVICIIVSHTISSLYIVFICLYDFYITIEIHRSLIIKIQIRTHEFFVLFFRTVLTLTIGNKMKLPSLHVQLRH